MRFITIAVAGLSVVFIALTLVPAAGDYRPYLAVAALICALAVLVAVGVGRRRQPGLAIPAGSAMTREAEIVGLLAILQDKGRLVDFLQDDIGGYTDAQVGAAARVVHQGCKTVLHEYFRIVPVRDENEGARVTVAAGYAPDEYRLVGKLSGVAPFSGTLMHRGWKADAVSLPRILASSDNRLPTIAPAEVEVR